MAKKDVIIPVPCPAARRRRDRLSACDNGPTDRGCTATSVRTWLAALPASSRCTAPLPVKNKPARLALLALAVIASVVVFFHSRRHLPAVRDEDDAPPHCVPALRANHERLGRRHGVALVAS